MKKLALALALLPLAAAPAPAAGPATYYFIAVQNGAYNFKGGRPALEESYKALQGMVKLAGERGVRLTLLFSAQYAEYVSADPARFAELAGWQREGHEVGAYHQGPETTAWDGYTDLAAEELAGLRGGAPASGGHKEYFAALARLEPGLKTGCMVGGSDTKFLAAAPPYEICLRGDPAGARGAAAGVNDSVFVPLAGGPRRNLSSYHPSDKAGIEAAQSAFGGMGLGVYGASFRSTPAEFGAFYAWLNFLARQDPQGLRSRTVASVVAGGLLEQKKAAPPAAKKAEARKQPLPTRTLIKQSPAVQQEQEQKQEQELPKLRPIPSLFGRPGHRVPSPRGQLPGRQKPGWCGDGICDIYERGKPGSCRLDCGK
ncbi:MAG: hypothetical protein A2X32_08640 [Elusimicrobia bacterium GWC2_64_44]|nr:MAG: hypothetical protein A2X32_08640 [Elusimicrobia bacterium GWC2_64_44]